MISDDKTKYRGGALLYKLSFIQTATLLRKFETFKTISQIKSPTKILLPLEKYVCVFIDRERDQFLVKSGAARSTNSRSRLSVAAVIFCIVRDRHRKEGLSFIAFQARYAGDFKCYGWTLF